MRSIKDSRINFKDQHFYIGMDVHKKQWTVSIRNNGLALKTFSMDPSPEMLRDYLEGHFPQGVYHVVYEVGFCGFWICRVLREMGIDCIVVHPPDIPTAHKEKDRKTDPVDAGKQARELEKGNLSVSIFPKRGISICVLSAGSIVKQSRIPLESRTVSKDTSISTGWKCLATARTGPEGSSLI